MLLDHLLVAAVVAFAAVYAVFWCIGLFGYLPTASRVRWIAFAAAGYVALQLGASAAGVFGTDAVSWLSHTLHGAYNVWSVVLFISAGVAALRLVTFRRGPSRHRQAYAWLSWLLVVGFTATAVKVVFGVKPPPGPVESLAMAVAAWRFIHYQGNLAHLVRDTLATFRRLLGSTR